MSNQFICLDLVIHVECLFEKRSVKMFNKENFYIWCAWGYTCYMYVNYKFARVNTFAHVFHRAAKQRIHICTCKQVWCFMEAAASMHLWNVPIENYKFLRIEVPLSRKTCHATSSMKYQACVKYMYCWLKLIQFMLVSEPFKDFSLFTFLVSHWIYWQHLLTPLTFIKVFVLSCLWIWELFML